MAFYGPGSGFTGTIPTNNQVIEGNFLISRNDTVVLNNSGDVDSGDDGLVVFLDNADLTNITTVLGSGTSTFRETGLGTTQGTIISVNPALNGTIAGSAPSIPYSAVMSGVLEFSALSIGGDSGGAYLLRSTIEDNSGSLVQHDFVIGTHFANRGTAGALGTYFTFTEWTDLNLLMEVGQTGNVTDHTVTGYSSNSEPLNMIVGKSANDAFEGSYRADILLGRGGDDIIRDGDKEGDIVWADCLTSAPMAQI